MKYLQIARIVFAAVLVAAVIFLLALLWPFSYADRAADIAFIQRMQLPPGIEDRVENLRLCLHPHPVRIWENRSGFSQALPFVFIDAPLETAAQLTINAQGMRGPLGRVRAHNSLRPGNEAEANTPVALLLGDAKTFSAEMDYAVTLAAQLQQCLSRSDGRKWTVLNASVPGYSSGQLLHWSYELLPLYKPDLVFVVDCEADQWHASSCDLDVIGSAQRRAWRALLWGGYWGRSIILKELATLYYRTGFSTLAGEDRVGGMQRYKFMRRLSEYARSQGVAEVVFIFEPDSINTRDVDLAYYDSGKIDVHQLSRDLLNDHQLAFCLAGRETGALFNAQSLWKKTGALNEPKYFGANGRYLSAAGNKRLAKELVDNLLERGVLPVY